MEFEIMCDKCKGKYHIILEECEKIAKPEKEGRVDFKKTKIEQERNLVSKCPNKIEVEKNKYEICNGQNVYIMDDITRAWYILYISRVNHTYSENDTNKANELIEKIKHENNSIKNEKIVEYIKELNDIEILDVIFVNNSDTLRIEDFKKAVKTIKESLK